MAAIRQEKQEEESVDRIEKRIEVCVKYSVGPVKDEEKEEAE